MVHFFEFHESLPKILVRDFLLQKNHESGLIILPTKRLRVVFLKYLTENISGVFLPKILTLENAIKDWAFQLSIQEKQGISSEALRWLMISIIRDLKLKFTAIENLNEITHLIQEMYDCHLDENIFERLRQKIQDDPFRPENVHSILLDRVNDLEIIFYELEKRLRKMNLTFSFAVIPRLIQEIMQHKKNEFEELICDYSYVWVCGLTTIKPFLIPFMEKFKSYPNVSFYLPHPPEELSKYSPLRKLTEEVKIPRFSSLRESLGMKKLPVFVYNTTNFSEQLDILNQKIQKNKTPLHDIAVITPDEKRASNLISHVLKKMETENNLSMAKKLAHSEVGRFLMSSLEFKKTKDGYFISHFKKQRLYQFLPISETSSGSQIKNYLEEFQIFLKTLAERIDPKELAAIEDFMKQLIPIADISLPNDFFWQQFFSDLSQLEIREVGEPLSGIQWINLEESRLIPFKKVFILNFVENLIPKKPPHDQWIPNYIKRQVGFLDPRTFEAMEDTSFSLLSHQVEEMHVMIPRNYFGEETVPSRFLAMMKNDDCFLVNDHLREIQHEDSQKIELRKNFWTFPLSNITFSSYLTECFIQCPFKFLMEYSRLNPIDLCVVGDDPKNLGMMLHQIVENFFMSLDKRKSQFKENSSSFYAWGIQEIEKFTEQEIAVSPISSLMKIHLMTYAWPKFLKFLQTIYEPHQFNFSGISEDVLQFSVTDVSQHDWKFKLRVDRWDELANQNLILDYKTRSTPEMYLVKKGIKPQLLLYLLGLEKKYPERFNHENTQLAYWSFLKGELSDAKFDYEEASEKFVGILDWRHHKIKEKNNFYADPSDCRGCLHSGLCRKDDPMRTVEIYGQMDLKKEVG